MIEGGREILKLSKTTREYIFFFLSSSSFLEEKEDDDCFFAKGENDRVRLRGLIYLCVRGGDCDMLALALSLTHTLS